MTTSVPRLLAAVNALAPVNATLDAVFDGGRPRCLAPQLLIRDDHGWLPATALVDGSRLAELMEAARQRWQASPHAAAALAWKTYSYWTALPAVLGWAAARRVPLLRPDDVLIRFGQPDPLLTVGLRPSVRVAVLAGDPLTRGGLPPRVTVAADEAALLATLRESLFDAHLTPALRAVQGWAKVGGRNLRGSVSSGIANGILRAAHVLPGTPAHDIRTLLTAFGIEDLVDLVPGGSGRLTVRRKTCCLAFTLPRPKVCAGCCLPRR